MTLPIWWQVVTPHKDIREGRLSEAVFAADLGDAVAGRGPEEYSDARLFLEKTYLTKGLENLIANVLSRLISGKGDAFIQLQTPFGGGKTHALLALYHIVKNFKEIKQLDVIQDLLDRKGIKGIGAVKLAVFVGTHADPLKGKTPWGELAEQLGCYDIVEEHDKKRVSPGKKRINEILKTSGPTLILIDELLEYIVKANRAEKTEKIAQGQTLAFIQELSEAVAVSPNCVLVLTLPASVLEQYDEEAEKSLAQIQKISGRVETIYTPVEGVEIYEVIRSRLFENLGAESIRKEVADWYYELYQKLGSDVPSEFRETATRRNIERAYPFHPELIDALYERWGSFPTFQRTRGVLRLLAGVTADLYKNKVASPLVQSSLVNLGYQLIRREFVKHIGNEYDSVIAADIAGEDAKAPKIDKDMGSEYEQYGIARGIASGVFLYSFSGGERKGITLPMLRVCTLREGIPPTIVGDAISKLENNLWYFHSEGQLFAFKNQPNLNRVIVDREETIRDEQIESTLKEEIQKIAGKEFEVYLWPKNSSDMPDNKNTKLLIFSPEYTYPTKEIREFARGVFSKAGVGFRVYKNNLFLLALDSNQYPKLKNTLKRYVALSEIQKDESIKDQLTKESLKELNSRLEDAEKNIPFQILTSYRDLAVLKSDGVAWLDLGIPTVGGREILAARVKDYLRDQEKILQQISTKYIIEKTFREDEDEKPLQEIREIFLKTPGLPVLENESVMIDAIREGVKAGIIGLRIGEKVYLNEPVSSVPGDAFILRSKRALEEKESLEAEEKEEQKAKAPIISGGTGVKPITFKTPKSVHIVAKIPWDKLSQIISGVIRPLKNKGLPPEITIELKANSEEGFDRITLDAKVKETLQQIGAEIKDWKEE
jgi:hypothetical protein